MNEKHMLGNREIVLVPYYADHRSCGGCVGVYDVRTCLQLPDCDDGTWHYKKEKPDE